MKDAEETIKERENRSKAFGLKFNKDKCRIQMQIQIIEDTDVVQEIKYLGITIANKRNCFKINSN